MSKDGRYSATLILMKFPHFDRTPRRVRKNWRDIYFLMFTRPGHFFLYLFVVVPVVRNWLTRYQMKDMDIIFHMIPYKSM